MLVEENIGKFSCLDYLEKLWQLAINLPNLPMFSPASVSAIRYIVYHHKEFVTWSLPIIT